MSLLHVLVSKQKMCILKTIQKQEKSKYRNEMKTNNDLLFVML